jgi:hypothetical protein
VNVRNVLHGTRGDRRVENLGINGDEFNFEHVEFICLRWQPAGVGYQFSYSSMPESPL